MTPRSASPSIAAATAPRVSSSGSRYGSALTSTRTYPSFPGARAAREAELARAIELAECGFVAHCDGTSHGKGRGPGIEWGPERLARVGPHADAAIAELSAAAFEPLDAERCAALLYGERGFWVGEHIDPADPPPAYGQFAHVALAALRQRAEAAAMPSPAG